MKVGRANEISNNDNMIKKQKNIKMIEPKEIELGQQPALSSYSLIVIFLFEVIRMGETPKHSSVDPICAEFQESKVPVGAISRSLRKFQSWKDTSKLPKSFLSLVLLVLDLTQSFIAGAV